MFYEATLIISSQVSHEEVFPLWEKISSQVQQLGASLIKEAKPLERNLASPMKNSGGSRRAYLGVLYLEPQKETGAFARALHETLKSHQAIVRFMVTAMKKIPETHRKTTLIKTAPAQHAIEQKTGIASSNHEDNKPPLAELDKKLEEILDDNIGF